jgi:radical SAM protein with 4Fe4S-binding SPASM domain
MVDSGLDGIIVSQYQDNLPKDDVSGIVASLPIDIRSRVRYRVMNDEMPLSTRGGLVSVKRPMKKRFCYQASTDLIVDRKGDVLLCCNDYGSEYIFGNIGDEKIMKIWNRPEFKLVRKKLRRGVFEEEMCRACAGEIQLREYGLGPS